LLNAYSERDQALADRNAALVQITTLASQLQIAKERLRERRRIAHSVAHSPVRNPAPI